MCDRENCTHQGSNYSRQEHLDEFITALGKKHGFTLDEVKQGAEVYIWEYCYNHDHPDHHKAKDLAFGWLEYQGIARVLSTTDHRQRESILKEYDAGCACIEKGGDPLMTLVSDAQIAPVLKHGASAARV